MRKETKNFLKGIAFISPWVIGFLVFQLYPIGAGIYYSFCYYDVLRPPAFIGLENYANLFQDSIANILFKDSIAMK